MPSKPKGEPKLKVSPVLFMTVEGEPMSFFLRPGAVKRELQPLIKSGGGMLCNVQKPGAVLLIDPEEKTTIPETTAHWYVSTKYIHDCIEKNEQLNLEDYRLNPETTATNFAKPSRSKERSPGHSGGRNAYTPEEDYAILSHVSKHGSEIGGNKLWQEMEKQQVTSHSWQSMKYRYRVRLAHRLSEFNDAETVQVEKEDVLIETDPAGAQMEEESASSEKSRETEKQKNTEMETDICLFLDEDEQMDSQQDECPAKTAMSEVDKIPEQEQQSTSETQTALSCEKDNVSETSTAAKSPEISRRPITRQLHELDNVSYVKRLRSSTITPEMTFKSPSPLSKTKTPTQSNSTKDTGSEQPPPKKARRKTKAGENVQEESDQYSPAKTTQTVPQNKAGKRKLGILELATKEFEDDSEPESLDPENQNETSLRPSTSTEPAVAASKCADPAPLTSKDQFPIPIQAVEDPQPTTSAASSRNPDSAAPEPATKDKPAVAEGTSNAHLFIFESESQEEESQSLIGESTSASIQPKSKRLKDTAPSLTQDQLEADIKMTKDLMSQTNQDLENVTKALLKTSGDVLAACGLLLNPSSNTGPFWTRTDDQRLLTANQEVRQELQTKYGEEEVAKRIMFLALEA